MAGEGARRRPTSAAAAAGNSGGAREEVGRPEAVGLARGLAGVGAAP
jgi:hypothetical protein